MDWNPKGKHKKGRPKLKRVFDEATAYDKEVHVLLKTASDEMDDGNEYDLILTMYIYTFFT